MTRGQIKTIVSTNLADNQIFSDSTDLEDSIQDAYDDIAFLTKCIVYTATVNWVPNLSYYDFVELGVSSYLGCLAIFNNVNNQWLRDDLSLRDFDNLRTDWEIAIGTPEFWAPSDPKRVAINRKYSGSAVNGAFNASAFTNAYYIGDNGGLGNFTLYYWATAPTLSSDSSTFLIALDVQNLLEFYATADQLEDALEFEKASVYWKKYYSGIDEYAKRVRNSAHADLLLRV